MVLAMAASLQGQTPAKPTPTPAPTIAGKWVLALEMQGTTATPLIELAVQGEKLTGFYEGRYGKFALTGTFKDKEKKIEFSFTMNAEGTDVVMAFKGEVAADLKAMKGVASMGEMGEINWSAKRPQ